LLKLANRQGPLAEVLGRIFPSLERLAIEFDEVNDRYISVTYREQGRAKELDVFSAGSGFQQFLYLFGFILLRQPTTILLDEPDVHLHGSLQRALLAELRRLVGEGKQVVFATHSRELIARMEPENILALHEAGARRLRAQNRSAGS
jgi:predicted ATPase